MRFIRKAFEKLTNIRIRYKIISIYFFSALLPLMVVIGLFYYNVVSKVEQNIYDEFDMETLQVKEKVLVVFQNVDWTSNWLALNNGLHKLVLDKHTGIYEYYESFRPIHMVLNQMRNVYQELEQITVFHNNPTVTDGSEFAYVENKAVIKDQFEYYLGLTGIKKGIYTLEDIHKNRLYLYRHLDLYKSATDYSALVRLSIDTDYFKRIFNNDRNIIYYMYAEDGIVIASNDPTTASGACFSDLSFDKSFITKILTFDQSSKLSNYKITAIIPKGLLLEDLNQLNKINYLILALCFVVSVLAIIILSRSMTERLQSFVMHMENTKDNLEKYKGRTGKDEIGVTINSFNRMIGIIDELIIQRNKDELRKRDLELENTKSKLYVLYSQINPHFLSNTLNCIRLKCVINEEKETAHVLGDLSAMFRNLMIYSDTYATVREEMDFIEAYLRIQKYRFEDKLNYTIFVEDEAKNQKIPRMTLQPLVENSCTHGIGKKANGGLIEISAFISNEQLCITIKDDGVGINHENYKMLNEKFKSEMIQESSIGLVNVYHRLKYFYGENMTFRISNRGSGGTEIKIIISLGN